MTFDLSTGSSAGASSAPGKPSRLGFEVSHGCRGPLTSGRSDLESQARSARRSFDLETLAGAGSAEFVVGLWLLRD